MDLELFDALMYLSILSPILPLILLFKFGNKLENKIKKTLILLLSLAIIADLTSLFLAFNSINNYPVIHFYTVAIALTVFYYYHLIIDKKWMSYILLVLTFFVIGVSLYEIFFNEGIFNPNNLNYSVVGFIFIFLSLSFFVIRLETIKTRNEIFDYLFWINCAILLYFGSTFILNLFENYIRYDNPQIFVFTWVIQLFATILFNLLIAKGIWTLKKV